jgi:hypothetical protein
MKLTLKRIALKETYTIGKLYIGGCYFCDTIEDQVRDFGVNGEGKIKSETAIPYGSYSVILNYSNRFQQIMPLLVNVPFFEGIRIHSGNSDKDTSGCILVGFNREIGKVVESKKTYELLMNLLRNQANINIEIVEGQK